MAAPCAFPPQSAEESPLLISEGHSIPAENVSRNLVEKTVSCCPLCASFSTAHVLSLLTAPPSALSDVGPLGCEPGADASPAPRPLTPAPPGAPWLPGGRRCQSPR